MTEQAEFVIVAVVLMKADGDTRVQGTQITWLAEDMTCVTNLREQLTVLFGEPRIEVILPDIAYGAIKDMPSPWPGAVRLSEDAS